MKKRALFPILGCSLLLIGGSLGLAKGLADKTAKKASAETEIGEIYFVDLHSASDGTCFYAYADADNDMPYSWDNPGYHPVDGQGGIFVNGQDIGDAVIKKVDIGAFVYYIQIAGYNLGVDDAGTVVEVTGSWTGTQGGVTYNFTVKPFYRMWNGTGWEFALDNYDVVSLEDANLPDFVDTTINTEDIGGNYNYTTDEAALPQRNGFFGLTNDTSSFAFQFYFERKAQMTGWLEIRFGAYGGWNTGHYFHIHMGDIWGGEGNIEIFECLNGTTLNTIDGVQSNLSGGPCLIEFGVVKILGEDNLYRVYFKNNDTVNASEDWVLDEAPRTTKVGIYTAATVSMTNSKSVGTAWQLSFSQTANENNWIYFTSMADLSHVDSWGDYYIPVSYDQLLYNGEEVGRNHWNYFKKVGYRNNDVFMDVGTLHGAAPSTGDILTFGGLFKACRQLGTLGEGVKIHTMFKLNFERMSFQFDGTKWKKVNTDYTAADFSKELLKMTLDICTGEDRDNSEALESVWSTLKDSSYYGKLIIAQKAVLADVIADGTIVVPVDEAGVDAMSDEDALAAAMFRYDFCTAKYGLTAFIEGRVVASRMTSPLTINNNSMILVGVLVAASISMIAVACFFLLKKKHQ